MRGRPTAVLIAALTLGIGAAGCGDAAEREAEYARAVSTAKQRFDRNIEALTQKITTESSPEEDRATLRAFRAEISRAASSLAAIDPPEELSKLHGELVESVRAYGPEVDRAREGLAARQLPDVQAAQAQFSRAAAVIDGRVRRAIAAINRELQG